MNISEAVSGSRECLADVIADTAADFAHLVDVQLECNVVLEGKTAHLFGNTTDLAQYLGEAIAEKFPDLSVSNHIAEVSSLAPKLHIASGYACQSPRFMPIENSLADWVVDSLRNQFPEVHCRIIKDLDRCQIDVRHPEHSLDEVREIIFDRVTPEGMMVGPEVNARGAWLDETSAPVVFSRQRNFLSGQAVPAIGRSYNHPERIASSLARSICISMIATGDSEAKASVGMNSENQIEFIELFTRKSDEWDQYILTMPNLDTGEIASKLMPASYANASTFEYYGDRHLPWEYPWEGFREILKNN